MKFVVREKRKFNFVMLAALAMVIVIGAARMLALI